MEYTSPQTSEDFFENLESKYRELGKEIDQKLTDGIQIAELKDRYESLGFRMEHLENSVQTQQAYAGSDGQEIPDAVKQQFQMFDEAIDELQKKIREAS